MGCTSYINSGDIIVIGCFDYITFIITYVSIIYVFEEYGEIQGFVGMDAEYIAGLFVVEGHQGHGTGHQLISEVKRKNRLSLHAYEKNAGAVAFYQAEGFHIENSMTEKETGEQEYRMVFHESDESKESCSK